MQCRREISLVGICRCVGGTGGALSDRKTFVRPLAKRGICLVNN